MILVRSEVSSIFRRLTLPCHTACGHLKKPIKIFSPIALNPISVVASLFDPPIVNLTTGRSSLFLTTRGSVTSDRSFTGARQAMTEAVLTLKRDMT